MDYEGRNWRFDIQKVGGICYLEITRRPNNYGSTFADLEILVEIKPGKQSFESVPPTDLKSLGDSLAERLAQALPFKKEGGMWVPTANPGDSVLVDRKDRPNEIQVVTQENGSSVIERIEKKKLRIEEEACVCPITNLMRSGCACGAVQRNKARAGE